MSESISGAAGSPASVGPRVLLMDYSLDRSQTRHTSQWLPQEVPCDVFQIASALGEAKGARPGGGPSAPGRTDEPQVALPGPSAYTHIIHSGSSLPIVEETWPVPQIISFAKEAAGTGVFQLGVCWGHQLLRRAFAGPGAVRLNPRGGQIGWKEVSLEAAARKLFSAEPTITVLQFHSTT